MRLDAESVTGGQPTLLHRGRGQGGKTDDIADRVDVFDLGAIFRVHLQAFAIVERQANLVVYQAKASRSVRNAQNGAMLVGHCLGFPCPKTEKSLQRL